jgi:hypothetical protein
MLPCLTDQLWFDHEAIRAFKTNDFQKTDFPSNCFRHTLAGRASPKSRNIQHLSSSLVGGPTKKVHLVKFPFAPRTAHRIPNSFKKVFAARRMRHEGDAANKSLVSRGVAVGSNIRACSVSAATTSIPRLPDLLLSF